mmetsp:Transcript_2244/g.7323  ORF Transcript_2244/g.7323 Transcript_2244/m.7323 type:complete len:230 (-) Transcript_2244:28-717(-)
MGGGGTGLLLPIAPVRPLGASPMTLFSAPPVTAALPTPGGRGPLPTPPAPALAAAICSAIRFLCANVINTSAAFSPSEPEPSPAVVRGVKCSMALAKAGQPTYRSCGLPGLASRAHPDRASLEPPHPGSGPLPLASSVGAAASGAVVRATQDVSNGACAGSGCAAPAAASGPSGARQWFVILCRSRCRSVSSRNTFDARRRVKSNATRTRPEPVPANTSNASLSWSPAV